MTELNLSIAIGNEDLKFIGVYELGIPFIS
jgi:hypothetical protein